MALCAGKTRPCSPLPSASRPTRQAWSSRRRPSALASAAWSSRWTCAAARGGLDLLAAENEVAGARLEAEPVQRRLAQRRLDPLAEIVGHGDVAGLERAGERALELALGLRRLERGAVDADPGAAAGRPRPHVGRDPAVGAEREADQRVPGGMGAAQDALTLGRVAIAV